MDGVDQLLVYVCRYAEARGAWAAGRTGWAAVPGGEQGGFNLRARGVDTAWRALA